MRKASWHLALASSVLSLAALAFAPIAAADNGVDITPTEGQAFTGRVLTTNCTITSASINWGDGTPASPGRDAGTPSGAVGDHTYAEEGSYAGTVTYSATCVRFATQHFTASVADAQLSAAGRDVSGAQGQELSGTVAHFIDSDPGGAASDYSATIEWGDGSNSTGTVAAAGGGFDVAGTHTYSTGGTFAVSVNIVDSGGSTAGASASAAITASPSGPPPPPPSSPPNIVQVDALGSPAAGKPIVLTAVADGTTSAIEWNLTGDSQPEITCSGAQTAVTFRAPAGNHTVTALAVGPAGKGSPFTKSFTVAPAAPLSGALRTIAGKVTNALAKKPPVYTCASPADVGPTLVKGVSNLTDHITLRMCVTPRTIVAGGLQFFGCLRRITSETQIPLAERGIIFPFGTHLHIPFKSSFEGLDVAFGLADAYITEGEVKVNGLTLKPGPTSSIVIAPQIDSIVSSDAGMSVGNIALQGARSFDMNLSLRGGRIPIGSFARLAGSLGSIAGFALAGNVDVALDADFALTIHVHLALPSFLEVGGVSVQGDVTLRATNDDGLVIDKLRIGPIDAEVSGLGISGLQLDYLRANDEWDGQGQACIIDGACLDMIPPNGGVVIRNGGLVRAGASLGFPPPGIQLFAGVALNRIGFLIGLDPTRFGANADITAEGLLEIDGHLILAFPSEATPFILDRAEVGNSFPADYYTRRYTQMTLGIGADAFVNLPIAGRTFIGAAYFLYSAPGYIGFGGGVEAHFAGIVDLSGRVDGEFNFANGRFSIKGDINACLAGIICAGAIGAISDRGAGGCVHIGTFLGDINIGGGVQFSPFDIFLWPFDGCRWSPFVDTHVFSSQVRAAAAGMPITVKIKRGEQSRAIRLDGIDGAPQVRVQTPDGKVLESSPGPGIALSPAMRILRSEQISATVVGLVNPVPGTYTIELLPGSPAIKTLTQANDQPPAHATGSVRGAGTQRTLTYNVASRTAQRVTFLEQTRGGASRTIGTINGGGKGDLTFTPAPGDDGRTVVAQFELAGLPAETVKIASFKPPSPRLAKPAHLRVARRGQTLAVNWGAVPGAARYEVVARLSFGAERIVRTRQHTLLLKRVARYDGGRISVRAVATMRQGKPALLAVPHVGHAPTRLGALPRFPRRR
jgi:hypothetical protein